MNVDLTEMAATTLPVLVAAWATYRLGRVQGRDDKALARRESAAAELSESLREMRLLVRRHGRVDIGETEVPTAFRTWFDAFDRHHTRLPDTWQQLGRSIRFAVGTAVGTSSFIDLRPDVDTHPLDEPDSLWQTFADDYLSYALDKLTRWSDDEPGATKTLLDYDTWLVRTGRREPFGQNQLA